MQGAGLVGTGEMMLLVGVFLCTLMTFAWMIQHAIGAYSLRNDLGDISQRALVAWVLSVVGGLSGACLLPAALISGVIGFMELNRSDASPATIRAARVIIRTSAIIVLMTVMMGGLMIAVVMTQP